MMTNILNTASSFMESSYWLGQIAMVAMLLLGLILWGVGSRLARVGCAISGLICGGLAAYSLPRTGRLEEMLVLFIVCGAVLGFILVWILFRAWMGVTFALLLALLAPATKMLWTNDYPEMNRPEFLFEQTPEFQKEQTLSNRVIPAFKLSFMDHVKTYYYEQFKISRAWWQSKDDFDKRTLGALALAGAVFGLFVGVVMPNIVAAFESSLVGAIFILLGSMGLMTSLGADQQADFKINSREGLVGLGLITFAGVLLQWITWHRNADKKL